MRTLYIVRHAKSSWAEHGMRDFDRPLNERGSRNAPFMARLFHARGEPVDLMVSSPANRALTTARYFHKELGLPADALVQEPHIYAAQRSTLLQVLNAFPDRAARIMLFGHNPGLTELIDDLSGTDVGNLPTCGIVRIDLLVEAWSMVSRDTGTLVWSDQPKSHPGQE